MRQCSLCHIQAVPHWDLSTSLGAERCPEGCKGPELALGIYMRPCRGCARNALLRAPFLPFSVVPCLSMCSPVLAHAGMEHSAVQGLRLLELYLRACSEQCDPAESDRSGDMHSIAAAAYCTARECIMQEWEVVCSDVLPQVTPPASSPPHRHKRLPGTFSILCSKALHGKARECHAVCCHARFPHCPVCCPGGPQQPDRIHLQLPGPGSAAPDLAGHPWPQRI